MARILVSGATGFLGSHLFHHLENLGHEVFGTTSRANAREHILSCDIRDPRSLVEVINQAAPQIIIHCAAISSVTSATPLEYYHVNTVGTENVVRAAVTLPWRTRFILISTAGVYGNQEPGLLSEGLCPKPVHHYGMSKFSAERTLMNFEADIDYTIIRPFNIIGEGQASDFIVPKLVDAFHQRSAVLSLGNVDVFRDYIDVLDACELINKLTFNPSAIGEISNLCTGRPTSIKELIAILTEITGHQIALEVDQRFVRKNEVWRLLGNTSKLEALTGGKIIGTDIDQSLRQMLAAKDRI